MTKKIHLVMFSESEYDDFNPVRAFASKEAAYAFVATCTANSDEKQAYDNTWHIADLDYTE